MNCDATNKNNPDLESNKRLRYAYFLANHPDTFEAIEKGNIILFHGTRSSALPSILKYGVNSVDEAVKNNISLTTGEEWSRIGGKRSFVSFTDDLETATGYASISSSKKQNPSSEFGVMIGISTEALKSLKTCRISSDTPEVGIRDCVPAEYIRMLAVPSNKVRFVKKLVGNMPIEVMPMNIEAPFYYMDRQHMKAELEAHKSKKEQEVQTQLEYSQADVKRLARGRKLSKLLGWLRQSKEKVENRGKNDEAEYR